MDFGEVAKEFCTSAAKAGKFEQLYRRPPPHQTNSGFAGDPGLKVCSILAMEAIHLARSSLRGAFGREVEFAFLFILTPSWAVG
jgi:hypothetical protein